MGSENTLLSAYKPYILESFYYADTVTEKLIPYFGDFLLDSGAFTLRSSTNQQIDWYEYVRKYSEFIIQNKVDKFFELDIDNLIGYSETIKLRNKLEQLTGKQSIPVWHPSRGWEEFKQTCKDYPYIALGGIVGAGKGSKAYKVYQSQFPKFIYEAHSNGAKIHGLGYTSLEGLKKNHFDSVDSTAWTTGNRFGHIYKFNGETMEKVQCPSGKRICESRYAALINFSEWIKFQTYALKHL